jgi:hypothetical protein
MNAQSNFARSVIGSVHDPILFSAAKSADKVFGRNRLASGSMEAELSAPGSLAIGGLKSAWTDRFNEDRWRSSIRIG